MTATTTPLATISVFGRLTATDSWQLLRTFNSREDALRWVEIDRAEHTANLEFEGQDPAADQSQYMLGEVLYL